jgi:hypothetical protein
MNQKILDLLYKSFEVQLTKHEQHQLERALADSEQLRAEKERIAVLRKSVAAGTNDSFKPFFADRVMQRIRAQREENEQELFFDSLIHFFRPIAIAAIVLVIILTGYNMVGDNPLTGENGLAITEISVEDAFDPMMDYIQE